MVSCATYAFVGQVKLVRVCSRYSVTSVCRLFFTRCDEDYACYAPLPPENHDLIVLGMRRPVEEPGGEQNRTEEHGVTLVSGVARTSKDAKEGLAALERFEGR